MSSLRAIDLYAGVGGWALGLKLAGIEVVASYEIWAPAVKTHEANLKGKVFKKDIRTITAEDVMDDLGSINVSYRLTPDFVVGSPPCTQFSYSNRGGSGDINDGLVDIRKFLEIVSDLNPTYWAMENVPRVAAILKREVQTDGALSEFAGLLEDAHIGVYDLSEAGLPQRRRRCIVGNFDPRLLASYCSSCNTRSLGDVVSALQPADVISDPIYALKLSHNELTETGNEEPLNRIEERYNREMKEHHPIYNNMAFPDPLDRPVRTITATCTRVSRESVVIPCEGNAGPFRRLNVRERASLQGFPINFQFLGASHAEKLKLVGNAIPPLFVYYLTQAFLGVESAKVPKPSELNPVLDGTGAVAPVTQPDREGAVYPETRSFRFAIKGLRFKSGMRFELRNASMNGSVDWEIGFHFGSSKDIRTIDLDGRLLDRLFSEDWLAKRAPHLKSIVLEFSRDLETVDFGRLQDAWRGSDSGTHPFDLLDIIEKYALSLKKAMSPISVEEAAGFVLSECRRGYESRPAIGEKKLASYALDVVVGIIVGCTFNDISQAELSEAA